MYELEYMIEEIFEEFLLFYLILVGLAIFIGYLISNEFHHIACQKGHTEKKYFWYCFFLGIIGYLMVIALPDLRSRPKMEETVSYTQYTSGNQPAYRREQSEEMKREIMMNNGWKCSKCGRANPHYTGTCACGNSKYDA